MLTNVEKNIGKTVDEYLNNINYTDDGKYRPSDFALDFINFIKMVNGGKGEENKSPVMHYKMLDTVIEDTRICNLCYRGSAKTSLLGEYLFLYLGVYGYIPALGDVDLSIYVSDSIENGVKNMRKNLEYRWENSTFLKTYIPTIKFTDIRWQFNNAAGKIFIVKGYGAKTGVRGTKELNIRPQLAVLDDLLSDEDAKSPTVIQNIEATIYKAITYALHPKRNMIIWSGTPFNAKDPLYKAVESGAWKVNVFPICEKFPCSREEFKGSWEDRFNYDYVEEQYTMAKLSGEIDSFNQEMMLRIMSDEDRLILDCDISYYKRKHIIENKSRFNFYITTDFATGMEEANDFSVISVWAYNNNGDWLWVDGVVKKQLMDQNINDLFRFAQEYRPQQVGIEVSGQQQGFIPWIQEQMMVRNVWFPLASENNNGKPGIRPVAQMKKINRFQVMVPMFKMNKMFFPHERLDSPEMIEAMEELKLVAAKGFKSKHDDFCDTISMLSVLSPWKPTETGDMVQKEDMWELDDDELNDDDCAINSYVV